MSKAQIKTKREPRFRALSSFCSVNNFKKIIKVCAALKCQCQLYHSVYMFVCLSNTLTGSDVWYTVVNMKCFCLLTLIFLEEISSILR